MDYIGFVVLLVALAIVGAIYAANLAMKRERREALAPPFANPLGEPWAPPPPTANDNSPPLTDVQSLVLRSMSRNIGFTAKELSERTGLTVAEVNAVRRELRGLGLAKFGPLYDPDGAGVRGSGYVLTREGEDAAVAAAHGRVQSIAA